MDKVDLNNLFYKVYPVIELKAVNNPNFINIRHDEKDVLRSKKYDMRTKSAKIKK